MPKDMHMYLVLGLVEYAIVLAIIGSFIARRVLLRKEDTTNCDNRELFDLHSSWNRSNYAVDLASMGIKQSGAKKEDIQTHSCLK